MQDTPTNFSFFDWTVVC